jgi:sec-independent protein translocase protein TatA
MYSGLLSPSHLIILLLIIALLFGAKRLPELGRSLGQGVKEFKEGLTTEEKTPKEAAEKRPEAVEGAQENSGSVKATQEGEHQRPQKKEAAS